MIRYEFEGKYEIKISQEDRLFIWWQFIFWRGKTLARIIATKKDGKSLAQKLTFCPSRWEVKVPLIVNIEIFFFHSAALRFALFSSGVWDSIWNWFIWEFNPSVNKYRVMVMAMVFVNGKCMKHEELQTTVLWIELCILSIQNRP